MCPLAVEVRVMFPGSSHARGWLGWHAWAKSGRDYSVLRHLRQNMQRFPV
jgi:hypothetical protein